MSAYLNTRVSLYSGRLWQPGDFEAVLKIPDAEMADALGSRGLPQLAAGFDHRLARLGACTDSGHRPCRNCRDRNPEA